MTKTSLSISKILQILQNENTTQELTSVLTYIRSNVGNVKFAHTIDEVQYVELCKLLLELVAKSDKNEIDNHIKKRNTETEITLQSVLELSNHHVNFFEMLLDFERKERVRVLEFLNNIETQVLARIIEDSMAVDVIKDCLRTAQPSLMRWLAASACTDNIQPLIEAETKNLSNEEENEVQLIYHTLTMLWRLYEYATINSSSDCNIERIHPLLFDRVISLAYMGHKKQRKLALKLLNQAINTNLMSHIKEKHSSLWVRYKNTLQNTYCIRMSLLVTAADHDWANQWCLSIKILGNDLHRGANLINSLLSVEEKAFKSTEMTIRKEAFESWKHLIDNFALNTTELTKLRRINLLCIPLNAKNSKIEMVAIAKLETWWHLMVKLYPNVDKSFHHVIEQFLNFCFGPLGDTPLLSKKCDVVASPGKRFPITQLMAIDALLQLLVHQPVDRHCIPRFIGDRLPVSLPNAVFQATYKTLFHSVGEAVLLINELSEGELKNRKRLNEMLWSNLMMYIQQSSAEYKTNMYRELILILGEVMSHIPDSPLIIGLFFDVIVSQFVEITQHYLIYHDTTLMDLLLKLLSPGMLRSADEKYLNDLTHLICHAMKPQNTQLYHHNSLSFIKTALTKMEMLMTHEVHSYIFNLWCKLAEIMIKYIEQNKQINEGTTVNHSFETIESLIIFPMQNIFWGDSATTSRIGKLWRELYKQFDMQTDLIATVKPNEILHNTTKKMEKCMLQDKRCYRLIAQCFDALMSTINYEIFLSENKIPPLIKLLRDVAISALSDMAVSEIELSLKATSSLLITVFGLNQKCTLKYLDILEPSIQVMLKVENTGNVGKEIINTWETVVIIFRGLFKLLTREFILSYQKIILSALRHDTREISTQAMSLINIESDVNKEAKTTLDEIEEIFRKKTADKTNPTQKNNEDFPKHIKIAGSFLNRKISSPKTVIAIKKECETKKMRVPSPLPPLEIDSQDYVVINSAANLDINRLTEHQKESLKRHRDDIPAMYNDLSRSESRNTQQLEEWFKNKSVVFDGERDVGTNADNRIVMEDDANKENNISSCVETIENIENLNDWKMGKRIDEDEFDMMNEMDRGDYDKMPKSDTNTQTSVLADENNSEDQQVDMETNNKCVSTIVAKKLDFDSREEFPEENEEADSTADCSSLLVVGKSDTPQEQKMFSDNGTKLTMSVCRVELCEDAESQSLESLHAKRRGRSRGRPVRADKRSFRSTRLSSNCDNNSERNLKRKTATDSESEGVLINKRRRYTTIPQSSSDTTSDTESINSAEGENYMTLMPNVDLPKRTKKEMSRLQINMVFNSRMPSKLRSKPVDDYVYGSNYKRQKNQKSDKSAPQNGSSQELAKNRRLRETRSLSEVKAEFLKAIQVQSLKCDEINLGAQSDNQMKTNDGKKLKDISRSVEPTEFYENLNSGKKAKIDDKPSSVEISNQDDSTENLPSTDNNYSLNRIQDEEEVVESSQITNPVLRSPHRQNHDDQCNSIVSSTKISPIIDILHEHPDDPLPNSSAISQQTENAWKSTHEKINRTITAGFNFSSPKSIKRLSRTKTFTPQGRTAHMLDLVTKLAIGEKNDSGDMSKYTEDELSKKLKSPKELEGDGVLLKKERALISKEADRIGSPCGSRQEKIFNNMKSKDYISSPPSKLFSNLKNNGEKLSPKFEKTISSDSMKTSDKDNYTNTERSVSFEKDELPLLEWSNANPPSLTASPSVSILKRQRQIMSDMDNDTMTSKRKRVSFTDPPVSREMGYEVISELSPIKANKLGQPRSLLGRKDTPMKMKQSRFRTIQIDVEKSDQLSNDILTASTSLNIMKSIYKENELVTKKTNESEENPNGYDDNNIDDSDARDNETNNTSDKSVYIENSPITSLIKTENADHLDHVQGNDITTMKKKQSDFTKTKEGSVLKTCYSKGHDDNDESHCDNKELKVEPPGKALQSQAIDLVDSSKFNITDDPTIARILNGSDDSCKSNNLEDTVDIQNVSNLNSTTNSDELFDGKLARTSTQIAAMTAIAQSDTLPITDSMFLSQAMSQDSLATQQSLTLSLPHTMDITEPICPTLLGCNDPIDTIVNELVNPLWTKNLSKYFATRNINTVGDLAQLPEREVARFPVKGSPKAHYVKQVLNKFSLSHVPLLEDETATKIVATTSKAVCSTPLVNEKCSKIVDETIEHITNSNYDDVDNKITADITVSTLSPVNRSRTNNDITERDIEIPTESLQKHMANVQSDDFGSIILDTSISQTSKNMTAINSPDTFGVPATDITDPPISESNDQHPSTSATKFEGVQMNIEKLLEEIDPNLLLRSAVKRNTPEDIAAQYKIKMKHKSEAEFAKESLRMLGLEMCTETELKNACHGYGLTKVLGRLPAIFNADSKFFTKVLNTYRMKITADDCIDALDFNEIKKAICKKCSSSELCDMLSIVLTNEEEKNINTPITEISSLNAMLRRMPMDSIISHTVANDEVIPSSFVLEIALQNNSPDVITHALDAQFPNIVENIMDRNMSTGAIISYMNKGQLSKDKLLEIYRSVCDKLSPSQLLDAHNEVMKKKISFFDDDKP